MTAINGKDVRCTFLRVPTEEQTRQIIGLYRAEEWLQPGDELRTHLIPRLIAGSYCFVAAVERERIVGMGRAISDGISDAYIQDLTVHADYRQCGIGTRIVETILRRLHEDGILWVGLISGVASRTLYQRAGFREMPMQIPMLMIKEP